MFPYETNNISLCYLYCIRTENTNLKKLRKQQESALAEVVHQREELMKWVTEEKQKTVVWCEEQRQLAGKERKAAAKAVSY